ncbi:fimbrial protein [Enterobacillus tribolii]|uniref:Minor fimbrial subunit n=1 Tax=Enterobacillus tribolii TaxID=1487935 RepID=A0A370QQL9_9GAMM|nr:fimbrial protein [Enterobacillus tribolii]MBW7981704.1 type 1 fimbrial protein [Enterobacillus tribolii]RDK91083.1 minor fimbrial subunit [Enterobacillus tribolii]
MEGLMKRSAVALLVLAGTSGSAFALDINVTGNVVASACDSEVVGGSGNTINLGDIQATTLLSQNSQSPEKEFQINLKDCPVTTTGFVATFSGTAATANNTMFANGGTAGNVEIRMVDESGNSVVTNKTISGSISSGGASIKLKTNAYSTQGTASPGTIQGTVQVSFTYS